MKKKLTLLLLLTGLVLTGYFLLPNWRARYEVIELPVLAGYEESYGSFINNIGYVLGECSRPKPDGLLGYEESEWEHVLWDRNLNPVSIPIKNWTHALNDLNQIAGTIGDVTYHQACVYDVTHGLQLIDIPDVTQTWGWEFLAEIKKHL